MRRDPLAQRERGSRGGRGAEAGRAVAALARRRRRRRAGTARRCARGPRPSERMGPRCGRGRPARAARPRRSSLGGVAAPATSRIRYERRERCRMTDTEQMASLEAEIVRLGAEETMKALCQGLAEAVAAAPRLPSKASVRFGYACLEVHWSDAPTVAATEPSTSEGPPIETGHVVKAELVGRFYRVPEPGAKP